MDDLSAAKRGSERSETDDTRSATPPDFFYKIVQDFIDDIKLSFPEYESQINKWWRFPETELAEVGGDYARTKSVLLVFRHCKRVYPALFMDILYQNADLFVVKDGDERKKMELLPGIDFCELWNLPDVGDGIRTTLWNYLRLISLAVVNSVTDENAFGQASQLFEAIDEDEFRTKLEETIRELSEAFDANGGGDAEGGCDASANAGPYIPQETNPENIFEHLQNTIFKGKIGALAAELAKEASTMMDLDLNEQTDPKKLFAKLIKSPGKLMQMMNLVHQRLREKIQSGEIKEAELYEESRDLLFGMNNNEMVKEMMAKMGLSGKMMPNMGAMNAQMEDKIRTAKMRDRLRERARQFRESQPAAADVGGIGVSVASSSVEGGKKKKHKKHKK